MRTKLLALLVFAATVAFAAPAQAYTQIKIGTCYARAGDVYVDLVNSGGLGEEPASVLLGASGSANCAKLSGGHYITMNLQHNDGSGWVTEGSESMLRGCGVYQSRYNCTLAANVFTLCIPGLWRAQTFFDGVEIDGYAINETCQERSGAP